jgi:hypothetical protein
MADEQTTRLDETIPGGKYLAADGKTFVDANGEPITVKDEKPEPKKAAAKGDQ